MKFDPDKHVINSNGASIRCKTCNKYYDRCICVESKGEPITVQATALLEPLFQEIPKAPKVE